METQLLLPEQEPQALVRPLAPPVFPQTGQESQQTSLRADPQELDQREQQAQQLEQPQSEKLELPAPRRVLLQELHPLRVLPDRSASHPPQVSLPQRLPE